MNEYSKIYTNLYNHLIKISNNNYGIIFTNKIHDCILPCIYYKINEFSLSKEIEEKIIENKIKTYTNEIKEINL